MINMTKAVLVILFFLWSNFLYSQEHVINGCFSDSIRCPDNQSQIKYAKGWMAVGATPDYYHTCFKPKQTVNLNCSVPNNDKGYQFPFKGNAYAGLYLLKDSHDEAIQAKIKYPLISGQNYYVEFYVSLAERSWMASSSIGVYFLLEEYRYAMNATKELRNFYAPYVQNNSDSLIFDNTNWVKISGIFKANGGEKYIVIGNSKPIGESVFSDYIRKVPRKTRKKGIKMAHYYIDAVSLWPVDSLGNKIHLYEKEEELDTLYQGESMVLKHIYFNVGESTLLPESYPYLDKIVQTLQEKPKIDIEISGHTDNTGIEKDNMQLSRARAKAVVDYLIKQGIKQDRLSYKGLGSSQPIETNTTEEGRAENRRVEITILPQKNE